MGSVGSILVMIGVVILPISTGDGALRVTRLMIADCFKLSQEQLSRRLMIAIPLFAAAICRQQHGLCRHLAVLRLGQPAAGRRHALGRFHLPAQQKRCCCWPAAAPPPS